MKKFLVTLLVIAFIGSILFIEVGCKSEAATETNIEKTAATEAVSGEPIKLIFWWWGEQELPGLEKWLKETVDLYQKAHPNITIETVLQSTETLMSAFKSAAAAQQGPDIQYFWGGVFTVEDAMLGNTLPISDYVSKEEVAHWPYAYEVEYEGKTWAAPWYVAINPVIYNKEILTKVGLDPENPPSATWDEFLAACEKIKAAGITPISLGGKDGFCGAWLASYIGIQQYDSVKDLMAPAIGEGKYTDAKYAEWWKRLAELRDNGYINEDYNSVELYQGQDNFIKGNAAFTLTTGTGLDFAKKMGAEKVGVMKFPKWGAGALAGRLQVSSQTVGITSWTEYPEESAKFIMFMKTPERLSEMYKQSGAMPSDDRFDINVLGTEQEKKIAEMMKEPVAPWGENYIPTQFDEQAYYSGVQEFFNGKTPEDMAKNSQDVIEKWRKEQPDSFASFKKWYDSLTE
ncbi:MAG: ABC transporter substrate-binding protein [Actinobacteria bacterium]|nr:ABC transporter substrate-binding protein [Actinomycetota bacterium]